MPTYFDPPEGWKYGFPRIVPEDVLMTGDYAGWLLDRGYPAKDIDMAIKYGRSWREDNFVDLFSQLVRAEPESPKRQVTPEQQASIDEIMDNFDFAKVVKVMQFLKWKWWDAEDEIPTEYEVRKNARRLLYDVAKNPDEEASITTGGFAAHKIGKFFELEFILTEWDNENLLSEDE